MLNSDIYKRNNDVVFVKINLQSHAKTLQSA